MVLDFSLKNNIKSIILLTSIYEELREKGKGDFVKKFYEVFVEEFAKFFAENGVKNPQVKARLFLALLDGLTVHVMITPETFMNDANVKAIKEEIIRILRC